jgi:peptidoglycan/xylan/chitin deacetylase (PgdA/CDA1 family)
MAVFLMYHEIGDVAHAELRYTVSELSFREQLAELASGGYEVLSTGQAIARPQGRRPRVVMTFDDGAASDYEVAAPLLARHGFGATFYVVPSFLGRAGYMTEAQIVELAEGGFEIGSHSLTHAYLSDLTDSQLQPEVAGSRLRLEQILGQPVRHFACPGGRVSRRVRNAVIAAGYTSLATSRTGVARADADVFALPRVAMYRSNSAVEFARVCRGEGLFARRLPEVARGFAKQFLGNDSYDRLRQRLLSHR